jgi:pyruvate dehydrogenase E1 component alpha subunit
MAALWQLPVIYVCENNLYNEYTHYRETTAGDLAARAAAFGILTEEVDGQDVRAVYASAARLVERARRGEGPAFLLGATYRYYGHHVGDVQRGYYRSREEEERWKSERDPITTLGAWLVEQGMATAGDLATSRDGVQAEIESGVAFALQAPYPDPSEVTQDVYA